ncbi:MAG: hypothetical protein MUE37_10200 [Bacteroidales bacterium]|jgi:hypothetical protein|nr:hypothetical protein [Bacteroidales bacterium]
MNLKETKLVFLAVLLTFLSSCETIPADRYGIDLPVGPGATGSTVAAVDFSVSSLRLTGSIDVTEGTILAEVMSPSGAVLFSVTVNAPGEMHLDRSFPAGEGEWRLRYMSLNGTGYIHLHLYLVR